ncbi:MAG: hypothetical protein Fur006_36140 [Coleofasciculaceae cyanobacterium]
MNIDSSINFLLSCCQVLDSETHSELILEILAFCSKLVDTNLVLSVFAPFNQGKSTLLNALLGQKFLPIGLVPTTGTAIRVKYGDKLSTCITLSNDEQIVEEGTRILENYTILDESSEIDKNVQSVEVFCPHPLLKNGIEFLDLPGSEDELRQSNLLKKSLLMSDIVIQVLDAQQLFTRKEKDDLEEWVVNRGIKTVIFVVNRMNLLEPKDQKKVWKRGIAFANEFRLNIPNNLSNIYRVDALPALKARLEKDERGYINSGLLEFETALQNLITIQRQQLIENRLPRLQIIARKIREILESKVTEIQKSLEEFDNTYKQECRKREQYARELVKGFEDCLSSYEDWLSSFGDIYWKPAAAALYQNQFRNWENNVLVRDRNRLISAIESWVNAACSEFEHSKPSGLSIALPADPNVYLPSTPKSLGFWDNVADFFSGGEISDVILHNYQIDVLNAYLRASESYLHNFKNNAVSAVNSYIDRIKSNSVFQPTPPEIPLEVQLWIQLKIINLEGIREKINTLENLEAP